MKPVNHIYLFRSNIDIRNENINQRLKTGLTSCFKYEISIDENGCAVIDKSTKLTQNNGNLDKRKGSSSEEQANFGEKEDHQFEKKSKVEIAVIDVDDVPHSTIPINTTSPTDAPETLDKKSTSKDEDLYLDQYWIRELGLKNRDKAVIEDGLWLNDRIMLAAMQLMKNIAPDVGGLQDVILAVKCGFRQGVENCVQILNVRGNHWMTIADTDLLPKEICVYDSLQALNVKGDRISYPISVEQAACQLVKSKIGLRFLVEDIQQQRGGSDCGLFAIAFAAVVCLGKQPPLADYKQDLMRKELVRAFENKDTLTYVNNVVTFDVRDGAYVLFEWNCRVYCHCLMPDDGQQMVKCTACNRWYHHSCEKGDFIDPEWLCTTCVSKKNKRSNSALRKNQVLIKLHEASKKYPSESQLVQQLYTCIVKMYPHKNLNPNAELHIGCMNIKEFSSISNMKRKCLYGITSICNGITFLEPKLDFFITIFHAENNSKEEYLSTTLHEISHVIDADGKTPHGKSFQKICKNLVETVNENIHELPEPYCNAEIILEQVVR